MLNSIKQFAGRCLEKTVQFGKACAAAAVVAVSASTIAVTEAQAAVPTEISDLTTDASAVWTTVKGIIIGVVAFMVLLAFAKRVVKR